MRLIIFGASGKVGRLAVAEALSRGHEVRAFIHHANTLQNHQLLTVFKGDVHNAAAVAAAINGCQAVVSTLGSWGTKDKDIVTTAIRHIVPAMRQNGIDRIVSLTGEAANDQDDKPGILRQGGRMLAKIAAHKILADGDGHISLLRASQLDWTVLRSPVMTGGADIFYKLTLQPQPFWKTIPRKAIAKAIIDQLEGPAYSQAAPFICRR